MSKRADRVEGDNELLDMLNEMGERQEQSLERAPNATGDGGLELLGGPTGRRRRRRAKTGKRSNENWTLASCYVEKRVYWAVKEGLAAKQRELGRKVDYSDLVNELLKEWCRDQGVGVVEEGG